VKVKDIIRLLEEDGWYLGGLGEVTANSSIPVSLVLLQLPGRQVLMFRQELSTAS
jgi:hypothetical protein